MSRNLSNTMSNLYNTRNLSNYDGDYTLTGTLPVVITSSNDSTAIISLKGLSGVGSENQIMKMNGSGALEWVADNNTEYTADAPISISLSNVISTSFTASSTTTMTNKTISDELHGSNNAENYIDFNDIYGFGVFGKYVSGSTISYNMSFQNTETTSTYPYIGVKSDGAMVIHINGVGDALKITIDQDVNITAGDIIGDTVSVTPFTKNRVKDIYCRYIYGEALAISNGVTSSGYVLLYEDESFGTHYTKLAGATTLAGSITLTLPATTDTLCGKATTDLFTNKSGSNSQWTNDENYITSSSLPTTYWDLSSNNINFYPKLDSYNVIIGNKTYSNTNNVEFVVDGDCEFTGKMYSQDDNENFIDWNSNDGIMVAAKDAGSGVSYNIKLQNSAQAGSGAAFPYLGCGGVAGSSFCVYITNVAGCHTEFKNDLSTIHNGEVICNANISVKNSSTSSGSISWFEDSDFGTNYIKVQAPLTDFGSNYTLTLPEKTDTLCGKTTSDLFTNKSGSNSMWTNDESYITLLDVASLVADAINISTANVLGNPDRTFGNALCDNIIQGTSTTINHPLTLTNGTTSAAKINFFENSSNGSAKITLIGVEDTGTDKVLTLPNLTDTLIGKATTDDLTNKTIKDLLLVSPTNTTSFYIAKLLAASMGDGTTTEMVLGVANATGNCATLAFGYVSSNHATNNLQIGLKGVEDTIKIFQTGKITIKNETTIDDDLLVDGNISGNEVGHHGVGRCADIYCKTVYSEGLSINSGTLKSGYIQIFEDIDSGGSSSLTLTIPVNLANSLTVLILPDVGASDTLVSNNSISILSGKTFSDNTTFEADLTVEADLSVEANLTVDDDFSCASDTFKVSYETDTYTYFYNPSSLVGGDATLADCYWRYHNNGSVIHFNIPYRAAVVGNVDFYYNAVIKQRLQASGICSTTGNWLDNVVFSDDRLKEEEVALQNCMETIDKLRPQIYKKFSLSSLGDENPLEPEIYTPFTDRISNEFTIQSGFIAQEVYTIPELKHIVILPEDSDKELIENTIISEDPAIDPDYEGWGDKQPACVLSTQIIPYLVGALQEQQKQINQLQVVVDKLLSSSSYKEFKSN